MSAHGAKPTLLSVRFPFNPKDGSGKFGLPHGAFTFSLHLHQAHAVAGGAAERGRAVIGARTRGKASGGAMEETRSVSAQGC